MEIREASKNQIKFLQSLKLKKYRQKYGSFILEGRKVVQEVLRDKVLVVRALYAEVDWLSLNESLVRDLDIPVYSCSSKQMQQVSSFKVSDAVLVECAIPEIAEIRDKGWFLFLDGLSDPGNLGTILRTADWFGVSEVILSKGSVDCYNAKCVQAAMGSIGRIHVSYLSFEELIKQFPQKPIYIAATGGCHPMKINSQAGILVIGSESHGVSKEVFVQNSQVVAVQQHPDSRVESLNAAIATASLLTILTGLNTELK